jgi:hypothetical protein
LSSASRSWTRKTTRVTIIYEHAADWRLSPTFTMNPVPLDIRPRVLTTAIDEADGTASPDLTYEVALHFGVKLAAAKKIGISERDLRSVWHHIPRPRREAVNDWLHSRPGRPAMSAPAEDGCSQLRCRLERPSVPHLQRPSGEAGVQSRPPFCFSKSSVSDSERKPRTGTRWMSAALHFCPRARRGPVCHHRRRRAAAAAERDVES